MKNTSQLLLASILLCGGVHLQSASAQAVLVFDDFLFDNTSMPQENMPGFPTLPNGFLEWTVTNGSVDLVGSSILNPPGDLFGRYVDLGGSTNDSGLFAYALPVNFLPLVSYTLSFSYNSVDGSANSATVNFGGQTRTVSSSSTSFSTFSEEFTFATLMSYTGALTDPDPLNSPLFFQDLGADTAGIGIDQVMVIPTIPEPATNWMIAGGLALIFFLNARKTRS